MQAAVRLNDQLTDWFAVEAGVRQGDNLAPTLFTLFIDDLVPEINSLGLGIDIGNECLSYLLYADDIVLLSDSCEGLQTQINRLSEWSKTWNLKVNTDKTKVMHVRKASKAESEFRFYFNDMVLEIVPKYRYLGLVITNHLDFKESVDEMVSAGSRSLGSLTSKYYEMDGMDYATYTKNMHPAYGAVNGMIL